MNFVLHLLLAAWSRLARKLFLVLLPTLVSEAGASMVVHLNSSRSERSQPYLLVCLPPPLRFSPPPVPPEMSDPTVATGPDIPGGPLAAISASNRESAQHATASPSPASSTAMSSAVASPDKNIPATSKPVPASVTPGTPPSTSVPASAPAPESSQPPSIIPDDTPQAIHSQDLLPYFTLPPTSSTPQPPSSATYHQQ